MSFAKFSATLVAITLEAHTELIEKAFFSVSSSRTEALGPLGPPTGLVDYRAQELGTKT